MNDFVKLANNSQSSLLLSLVNELKLGPSEIYIQVEGSIITSVSNFILQFTFDCFKCAGTSMQTLIAKQDQPCSSYYGIVRVPVVGSHRLKVFRIRQNYAAISQEKREVPHILYEPFCDEKLSEVLVQARSPCSVRDNRLGYWVANVSYPFAPTAIPLKPDRGLPLSTYIKVSFSVGTVIGPSFQCGMDVDFYRWDMNICREVQKWKPFTQGGCT